MFRCASSNLHALSSGVSGQLRFAHPATAKVLSPYFYFMKTRLVTPAITKLPQKERFLAVVQMWKGLPEEEKAAIVTEANQNQIVRKTSSAPKAKSPKGKSSKANYSKGNLSPYFQFVKDNYSTPQIKALPTHAERKRVIHEMWNAAGGSVKKSEPRTTTKASGAPEVNYSKGNLSPYYQFIKDNYNSPQIKALSTHAERTKAIREMWNAAEGSVKESEPKTKRTTKASGAPEAKSSKANYSKGNLSPYYQFVKDNYSTPKIQALSTHAERTKAIREMWNARK